MDVREKLVELIHKAKLSMWGKNGLSNEKAQNSYIADYLIAHGATVQGWISVKDGLPEETQGFLVVLNNEDIDIRVFNSKNEPCQTYSSMLNKFLFLDDKGEWHTTNRVTHWMPLPQPPKGE